MKTIHNPFIRRAFLAATLTACIAAPTAFAADLTWDNGAATGNWNTTDANWTSSTWSNANPDNAVFNNRNETVTLTEAITAGSLSFLAGGRQSGTHLLPLTGSSLSLASITVNGIGLGGNVDSMTDSANQRLKLNNISVTASGDVSVARGSMEVSGTTALNISGKLLATGDWSNFVMGSGTSVTVTGGVDFYNSKVATNLDLNGGTLTTASIYGNSHSGSTFVNFNGSTVVATADNADFLQVHQSGSAVTRASARLRPGGLIFDTNGHAVTIANVLADGGVWYDTGSLTKIGAGTLTLSSANTYIGTTTVRGGTLTLSGASALSGAITVASVTGTNGTLEIQNGTYALGSNSFNVGDADNATGTVNQSGGAVSFTGGNGLLIGAPTANRTGSVAIYNLSGGSISVANASNSLGVALGVNSGLQSTFNLSGSGNLTLSSSTLQIGRSSWTSSNTTNVFNQTGGTASVSTLTMGGKAAGSTGVSSTLTLTGGTFSASAFTILAAGNTNTAVINIGGTADVTLPAFPTARDGSSTATLNLDGGTLRPAAASGAYISGLTNAFILDGGAKINVASGNDITITQNLLTDVSSTGGGLTKDGVGSLTLTGINTYTGDTTVNQGTLSLGDGTSNTSLADTAKVFIASGATLNLNYSGTDAVTELWVNGVQKAPGVYEAVGNPGSGTEIPEITGSGTLTVGAVSSPYDTWATSPPYNLSGPNAAFDFDYDNDGLDNGLEWILGGNPTVGDNPSILPVVTGSAASGLTLVFDRATASLPPASSLIIDFDSDLDASWAKSVTIGAASSGPDANGVVVAVDTPSAGKVTVTIPASNAAGGKLFARLRASQP